MWFNAAVDLTRRVRWVARVGLPVLVAAGLNLVAARAVAATDYFPVITVTGGASCSALDGTISVGWTISQNVSPQGFTYGGPVVSLTATPNTTLSASSNFFAAPIHVSTVIPHGSGASTATLTVAVNYDLPTGQQVITGTGSLALPSCLKHEQASVTFAMTCDVSCCAVDVTITYPPTGEATTFATVHGASTSGGAWESGPVPLKGGGDVKTVLVPWPYTPTVSVFQPDASPTQQGMNIGLFELPPQALLTCQWVPPPPTEGPAVAPPPVQGSVDPAPPQKDANPSGPSQPAVVPSTQAPTGSTKSGSADWPLALRPLAAVGAVGAFTGLGTLVLVAAGLVGVLIIRPRRRRDGRGPTQAP